MARLFRWLLRIVTGAFVLGLAATFLLYWFFSRSIPDYGESLSVSGISGEVEIVRDNAIVPHIFGPTDNDVYFGLGLAHAQDRLWQMMMLRRTAQGRLSELFGTRTVKIDELLRRFDFYALSVRSVAAQDDYTKAALEAYADGVNAWLAKVNEGARGRGAPEFWLFEPSLAPWQPADSIAIGKLMALRLSSHLESEVLRARVSQMVSDDRLLDLLFDDPGNAVAALPDYARLFAPAGDQPVVFAGTDPTTEDLRSHPFSPIRHRNFGGASNAWAAAPSRSAAGGTLLANDPHLEFDAPSIWYLARLELESGGIIGGTIPGAPTMLVGRSDDLGWALTSTGADDQDVFIERLNPDNPEEVLTPNGWRRLASRSSIITVKDAAPVTAILRWSETGPLLPGSHYDLGEVTPRGHVASLGWTALRSDDTTMSAVLGLMRSASVEEAMAAGENFVSPPQNLTVVDREQIALTIIGVIAIDHHLRSSHQLFSQGVHRTRSPSSFAMFL